jgi:hypothetical protein
MNLHEKEKISMDTKKLLKNILLALREQGKANKASALEMYVSLVKYAFLEEKLTQDAICDICNISRRTLCRIDTFRVILTQNATEWHKKCQSDTSGTKETESERESFPQTPFIEKGKGKENLTSSRCDEGDDDDVCDSPHNTLSPMQSQSICKHHVTQGDAAVVTPDVAEEANIPRDQVAKKVNIKHEAAFATFVEIYPKRRGLEGTGYFKVRKAWCDCEQKGWTGELILAAVNIARKTDTWKCQNRRFVPIAFNFLSEERMREFLPDDVVCKALNLSQEVTNHLCGETETLLETVILANPSAFEEFCTIYPKKRGLLDPKEKVEVAKAWKGCEERGWLPYDIVRALKEALTSKRWCEDDGLYIPTAEKFLKEEQMRQFLPIGFNPRGGTNLASRPLTEEEAYWLNVENFA